MKRIAVHIARGLATLASAGVLLVASCGEPALMAQPAGHCGRCVTP